MLLCATCLAKILVVSIGCLHWQTWAIGVRSIDVSMEQILRKEFIAGSAQAVRIPDHFAVEGANRQHVLTGNTRYHGWSGRHILSSKASKAS